MTGGKERETLMCNDQLLLAIGIFFYPGSTSDESHACATANGGDVHEKEDTTFRAGDLNIIHKWLSKEACNTFSPSSLRKL